MRNPSLFPMCWGALTLAALLGCATGPPMGLNSLTSMFSMPCNEQEAKTAGYKQGRAGSPQNLSVMDHCREKDAGVHQAMISTYQQAHQQGAADLAQAKQEAYMRAQAQACDVDRAFQTGETQGSGGQERNEGVLDACELADKRTLAIKQLRLGYKQGARAYQDQVCDPQQAYEQGYNAAIGEQAIDSSWLRACTKSSRRRKATRQFNAGVKAGTAQLRKDRVAADRQAAADRAAREAQARREAEQAALATCDRQAAHQRGYDDGARGNALDSSYITACPRSLARREALDSYRVGYAEGRRSRVAVQQRPPAPVPRAQPRGIRGVVQNLTHHCNVQNTVTFQFRVGNRKVDKVTLGPDRETRIDLQPGTYDVDTYKVVGGSSKYLQSSRLDVSSNTWTFWYGCKAQKKPVNRGPVAMSRQSYRSLLGQLGRQSYDSGKLTVIKEAAAHNNFTSAQVKGILKSMTYDSEKVKAGVILHPRVVDLNNWFMVYDAFTYDSSKQQLRKSVGR